MSNTTNSVCIGIIGGTGLENPTILQNAEEKKVDTPFGAPSDTLKIGLINGVRCVILPRHGRKHSISPTQVNYRANLWALKHLGCTHVLVTTACGSLREEIVPGDLVVLDQFIDRTTKRHLTFYDGTPGGPEGVCHIPMNPVFCSATRQVVINAIKELNLKHKATGTIVVIEGPRFSSKAESNLYRQWGADVVGMTTVPEVILAKELGLCYAAIAMPTDYDCWRDEIGGVCVEDVMKMFEKNVHKAIDVLKLAIKRIAEKDWSHEWKHSEETVKKAVMLHK